MFSFAITGTGALATPILILKEKTTIYKTCNFFDFDSGQACFYTTYHLPRKPGLCIFMLTALVQDIFLYSLRDVHIISILIEPYTMVGALKFCSSAQ